MKITGSYSNFAAQAYVRAQVRAGRLEDRDYTIEEVESLYDSFLKTGPTRPGKGIHQENLVNKDRKIAFFD